MKRVTGIGGIFFRSPDTKATAAWYRDHLGVPVEDWGGAAFPWHPVEEADRTATTVWSPFAADSTYFPTGQSTMVNYRVENLDAVLTALRAEGVRVEEKTESSEFGRFGWVYDPDGNKIELWEPPDSEKG